MLFIPYLKLKSLAAEIKSAYANNLSEVNAQAKPHIEDAKCLPK